MLYLLIFIGAVALCYLWPLFFPCKPVLPILLIAEDHFSHPSFEKLLRYLQKNQFHTILPSHAFQEPLPTRPLLLILAGGYQQYFQQALPLLEKYQACAAVAVPVEYIGQYDAWKPNGPWTNLLTLPELLALQKSGRVEILSQTMHPTALHRLSQEELLWQLEESKNRLQAHKIKVQGLLLPPRTIVSATLLETISKQYRFCVQRRQGNNAWPLSTAPWRVFFFSPHRCLRRLSWQLRRR